FIKSIKSQAEKVDHLKKEIATVKQVPIPNKLTEALKAVNVERYPSASIKIGEIAEELRKSLRDRGGLRTFRKLHNKMAFNKLVKVSDDIPKKAVDIIQELIDNEMDKDDIEKELLALKAYFE